MRSSAPGQLLRLVVQVRVFVQFKQLVLSLLHLLRPGACLRLGFFQHVLQHFLLAVVIPVIAAGDHVHEIQLFAVKRHIEDVGRGAGCPAQAVKGLDQVPGHFSARLIPDAMPVEVVQARKAVREILRGFANGFRFAHHRNDRDIAQTRHFVPVAVFHDGFRHHAAGVGEVHQPCIGTQFLHILHDVQDHRNRAQCLEDPAGSIGLLTGHAIGKGDPLVLDPGRKQSHPELRGDKIRVLQRFTSVKSQMHLHIMTRGVPHPPGHFSHDLQLLFSFLDVHQPDFPDRHLIIPVDESFHELRGIGAAAANGHDFHAVCLFHSHPCLSLCSWPHCVRNAKKYQQSRVC